MCRFNIVQVQSVLNCVHVQYIPYPVAEPRFLVPQNIRPTSWPTHGLRNKLIR